MYNFRWSNVKVSALDLQAPLSIAPSVTCQEAIDVMKKEGFDQLPVVDNQGYESFIYFLNSGSQCSFISLD